MTDADKHGLDFNLQFGVCLVIKQDQDSLWVLWTYGQVEQAWSKGEEPTVELLEVESVPSNGMQFRKYMLEEYFHVIPDNRLVQPGVVTATAFQEWLKEDSNPRFPVPETAAWVWEQLSNGSWILMNFPLQRDFGSVSDYKVHW